VVTRNKGWFKKGSHWRDPRPFWVRDWLFDEYITNKKSASEIAIEMKCTENNILYWLKKHNISTRNVSDVRKIKYWGSAGDKNPMFGKVKDQNPNWNGGHSPERQSQYARFAWKELAKSILKRDRYECKKCGEKHQRGHRLFVHHIKPWSKYPDLRFNMDNLVTLCENCHRKEHGKK
jgi:hypothetical protein